MKKILFISHDATRTGAPILLLNLMDLVKQSGRYTLRVVVKNGNGDLLERFMAFEEACCWRIRKPVTLWSRVKARLGSGATHATPNNERIQSWINSSDVIISNTITNGDFFRAFNLGRPGVVASYVHELHIAAQYYTTTADIEQVLKVTNRFLVPSDAVAAFLHSSYGITSGALRKLRYYIPGGSSELPEQTIKSGPFIVGMAGTLDWRKGADILTVIISRLFRKYPGANIRFRWQGASDHFIEYQRIVFELGRMNLTDRLELLGPSNDMETFYRSIDLFLLCSKEDPYPLVVLEAAARGKPCVCFKGAGGAPEFVQDDAGASVEYLDTEAMVDTIHQAYQNPDETAAKGLVAWKRYCQLHRDGASILETFESVIEE